MTTGQYEVTGRVEHTRNRVFAAFTDQVVLPDGSTVERDYVRHVGAVSVVALDADDRVVLVSQYRHPVGRTMWELPAGLVDVPGEPFAAAAARELAEEADLVAGRWELLAEMHTSPGYSDEKMRIFLARDLSEVPEAERHSRTHEEADIEVRLVPLDEAVAMAFAGEITNAACVAGVFAAAQARADGWKALRPADAAT